MQIEPIHMFTSFSPAENCLISQSDIFHIQLMELGGCSGGYEKFLQFLVVKNEEIFASDST